MNTILGILEHPRHEGHDDDSVRVSHRMVLTDEAVQEVEALSAILGDDFFQDEEAVIVLCVAPEAAAGDNDRDCLRLVTGMVGTGRMVTRQSLRGRVEGAEEDRRDDRAVRTEASCEEFYILNRKNL